jgi:protocatechuate 3,4-dioxygenase alpha subunit
MTHRTSDEAFGLVVSQTVGPFFQIGFADLYQNDLTVPGLRGRAITIGGRVLDADRLPVSDAVIEIWQANSLGKYAHPEDVQDKPLDPGFTGFGRWATDANGRFSFRTIKPGPVPFSAETSQAPHINVSIFMRGLLDRLVTRIYLFGDERNDTDAILNLVEPDRRSALLAQADSSNPDSYIWNVILQGPDETVFFDF